MPKPKPTLAPVASDLPADLPAIAALPAPTAAPPPPPEPDDDPCAPPEPYDPAAYRWVPVRRQPRYDGWTEEKQRRFIEALADTGQVRLAAEAVGMSRAAAYQLRRAPHAAAFARAWDAARGQAGTVIEDVAFERALEGVAHNVYDEHGEVVCSKRVFNDRLLMFLLRSLKPERYARHALATLGDRAEPRNAPAGETIDADPCGALNESLAALEPQLPAPAEDLLDPEALADELEIADAADGSLPRFLSEQRPAKSAARIAIEAAQARYARGKAADAKFGKEEMSKEEFKDMCWYYDPTPQPSRKRYR